MLSHDADVVHELLATEAALDKLGARDISADGTRKFRRVEGGAGG
jgi:hypothetical protein